MLKHHALTLIAEKVSACTKCRDLTCYREANGYKTVPGDGNSTARIMMIGEAPGQTEAETGIPFVGKAGKLLDILIRQAGWRREDVFVCNILRCRPPDNRDPTREEANNCRPYLDLQIRVIGPEYIVCLGKVAVLNLLKPDGVDETWWFGRSLNSFRGEFHDHKGIPVLCTYHPSYLLRNYSAERIFVNDLRMINERIRKNASPRPESLNGC